MIDAAEGPYHPSIVPKGGITVEQRNAARVRFYERFGLPLTDSFQRIRISDSRWPALIEGIRELSREGALKLKSAWVEEPTPKPRPSNPDLWFELQSGPSTFKSPARVAKGEHFGWRDFQKLASAQFKQAVQDAGLTGLGWLPLVECRADDPMVWYEVYAEQPMGRGLDHPLLNPETLEQGKDAKFGKLTERRWGEKLAWQAQFRPDVAIEDPVLQALIEFKASHLRVVGPPRFVREHLPPTDFAYSGWGLKPDTGPGFEGRVIRDICCNDRARRALIESDVMKPSRFTPLLIVAADNARAAILDRVVPHALPLPMYTPNEAAVERARRLATIEGKAPDASALRFKSTDEAEQYLRRRIHDGSATWTPASETEEFAEVSGEPLFRETPGAWQRLASLLPLEASFEDEKADEFVDVVMQPPAWNEWMSYAPGTYEPSEEPSTDDLIIACTPFGDWYAFRKGDPLLPDDARIVHWDHETTLIQEEWPSIAAFAAHIITICDRTATGR